MASKLGAFTWYAVKLNNIMEAVDLYEATRSDDAAVAVATELGELIGIGVPLWYLDKIMTKTGLDRVFDSLRKNQSFGEYIERQAIESGIRDISLGFLAEWGIGQFRDWISYHGYLDPVFRMFDGTYNEFVGSFIRRDPLILDLDGDGIETVAEAGFNGVKFDYEGDGTKTPTGWVGSDDGLLVLDRNGNGTIDNGAELFRDYTPMSNGTLAQNGIDALRSVDSNSDGIINASDAQFANLRVWRDLNQDGVSQSGELFTLSQLGITAINTNTRSVGQGEHENGNVVQAGLASCKLGGRDASVRPAILAASCSVSGRPRECVLR